jgi:hypothetical protein
VGVEPYDHLAAKENNRDEARISLDANLSLNLLNVPDHAQRRGLAPGLKLLIIVVLSLVLWGVIVWAVSRFF